MIVKNYTTRPINIIIDGKSAEIKQHGLAYVIEDSAETITEATIDGLIVPIVRKKFNEVFGLPKEQEGVLYIVSNITAQVAKNNGRKDCITPNTLRDTHGKIIGCSSFGFPV